MAGFSYDDVPYESHSYGFTHPRYLYTVGRLFRLRPPDFRQARVLELGCAAGGNIIPIAYHHPECRIVGIDLSEKQLGVGRELAAELGLTNLKLITGSILEIEPTFGEFDYIICHGVYSWVAEEVKAKILAVCRDNLAANGIAVISYNTLPGWNAAKTIRDLMLFHAGEYDEPEEQANQARSIVDFIYEGLKSKQTPYTQFLKAELEIMSGYTNEQLLHDHLEQINQPLYFHQFIGEINNYGLRYLGDAPLANMYHKNLPDSLAGELEKLEDVIRIGQYLDFIYNQRFRSTLICHDNPGVRRTLCRKLQPEMMQEFFFALEEAIDEKMLAENPEEERSVEINLKKRSITVDDTLSKLTLLVLVAEKGKPLSFGELVDKILQRGLVQEREQVARFLMYRFSLPEFILYGILDVYPCAVHFTTEVAEKPQASPLARLQARRGTMVTSQLHHAVALSSDELILLQYCDGDSTLAEIHAKMSAHLRRQKLIPRHDNETMVRDEEEIRSQAQELCQRGLRKFAGKALLI